MLPSISLVLPMKKENFNYVKSLIEKAMAGDKFSQMDLAIVYHKGELTDVDLVEACYWYEKAALQGLPMAEFSIGFMLEHGFGTAKNEGQALYWYKMAADHGIKEALFTLGLMHEEGRGCTQDIEKANIFYYKCANLNCPQAIDKLRDLGLIIEDIWVNAWLGFSSVH